MNKTTVCALIAGVCTAAAAHATTWYFNGGNDTQNGGVSTPSKWVDAGGHAATAFSADDSYIVRGGSRLRIKGYTFTGGTMQFESAAPADKEEPILTGDTRAILFGRKSRACCRGRR